MFAGTEPAIDTEPIITREPVDEVAPTSCPNCHRVYADAEIYHSEPSFSPQLNGYVMERELVCRNIRCARRSSWLQRCTDDGTPLPMVVGTVKIRRITGAC